MNLVRYYTGLRLEGLYCSFCDARTSGVIFQEGPRWMARLDCGHLSMKGWTQDPDELERLGLINQASTPDPRIESRNKQQEEDRLKEAQEKLDFELRQAHRKGQLK